MIALAGGGVDGAGRFVARVVRAGVGGRIPAVAVVGRTHVDFLESGLDGGIGVDFAGAAKGKQWSYPYGYEHDGKLFVVYSIGKEDCGLSVMPIKSLAAR